MKSSSRDHELTIGSALDLYEAELVDLAGELEALDYAGREFGDWSVTMGIGHWRCVQAFLKAAFSSAKPAVDDSSRDDLTPHPITAKGLS